MVGAAVRTDGLLRSSRGNKVRGYRQAPHNWYLPHVARARNGSMPYLTEDAETKIMSIVVDN